MRKRAWGLMPPTSSSTPNMGTLSVPRLHRRICPSSSPTGAGVSSPPPLPLVGLSMKQKGRRWSSQPDPASSRPLPPRRKSSRWTARKFWRERRGFVRPGLDQPSASAIVEGSLATWPTNQIPTAGGSSEGTTAPASPWSVCTGHNGGLCIGCSLDGRPCRALVDTGSTVSLEPTGFFPGAW